MTPPQLYIEPAYLNHFPNSKHSGLHIRSSNYIFVDLTFVCVCVCVCTVGVGAGDTGVYARAAVSGRRQCVLSCCDQSAHHLRHLREQDQRKS